MWLVVSEKEIVLTIINKKNEVLREDGLMAELLATSKKDILAEMFKLHESAGCVPSWIKEKHNQLCL